VGGADCVRAHIFQQLKLVAQSGAIHGSAQRAEVVVVANAAEFRNFTVQEEAF
jgi:hypothetical protein